MTEKQLQNLLALKRCERPSEDRLAEVETLFRYNLRIERMKEKTRSAPDLFALPAWFVRWSPVAACVAVVAIGAAHITNVAGTLASNQKASAQPVAPMLVQPLPSTSMFDFFSGVVPDMPVAAPVTRSYALEATPVVFDESRITY